MSTELKYRSATIIGAARSGVAAAKLLKRKVAHIESTRVTVVATSNPGCHLQLASGLQGRVEVTQPVTLLARAYRDAATGG